MQILGVRIDNLSRQEILEKIGFFLNEEKPGTISGEKVRGKFHQIATVNPEFILKAQKDADFKNILNKCALNIADGIGIKYAFLRHGAWLRERIAGADLMEEILQIANEKKSALFLAIHPAGLSSYKEIRRVLNKKYPDIQITGAEIDPKKNKRWPAVSGCQLVFCNFGFPQQEKFINCVKNDTIRLAMGVGGAFDFVTGKVQRAPVWMRKIGLEWLWRLILEPRYRIKRIFNAIAVFPIKIIFS